MRAFTLNPENTVKNDSLCVLYMNVKLFSGTINFQCLGVSIVI